MSLQNIFILDDHSMIRSGIRSAIDRIAGATVVGEAGTVQAAIQKLKFVRCDLMIADISLPDGSGLEAFTSIRKIKPEIKVIFLTMHRDWTYLEKAIQAGAHGYFLKEQDEDSLVGGIEKVLRGEKAFPEGVTGMATTASQESENPIYYDRLTSREREILGFVARGRMNREIAEELQLSIRTIESHRSNIMEKLGIKNSAELMRVAVGLKEF